ncbi:hypothetical protein GOODEAATRI_020731 [Goodea atripinnis]|uniref:Uncharacterized protein n=1 Tax=Goodea atripinnis TaxID=208336 RepID=A0ABV0MJK5_9TELE
MRQMSHSAWSPSLVDVYIKHKKPHAEEALKLQLQLAHYKFSLLRIPIYFSEHLIILLGRGAPVAPPLQHVADHHPNQTQKEKSQH